MNGTSPIGAAPDTDEIDLGTSVAGEEDPGASNEVGSAVEAPGARNDMAPGDQAPAGTPGTGEDVCPECGGSGRTARGVCPNCRGTGKVTVAIGGA
jgi:hypothetical protein